ncbi:MAG: type I 3-dehydroquinate dehydratase [Akkermansiaceae bacterium]|nr:type I 3-dehydroquinate dehydratase [Akkermansiaceae bacterium]
MAKLHDMVREGRPLIVGSIGESSGLGVDPGPERCDVVEVRLDLVGTGPEVVRYCRDHAPRVPILMTARHPGEGGAGELSAEARSEALRAGLDHAAAIDVEIRSLESMEGVWKEAGARRLLRIASYHDFDEAPRPEKLAPYILTAQEAGADVVKFAFRVAEPGELHSVAALLRLGAPLPLAVMGMGPLGPASRVLAMQLGSILNYGYLGDGPTAPGQWPASLLAGARDAGGFTG